MRCSLVARTTGSWAASNWHPATSICHNRTMSLLAPAEQEKLREWFNEMTGPVRLLFFTQTIG